MPKGAKPKNTTNPTALQQLKKAETKITQVKNIINKYSTVKESKLREHKEPVLGHPNQQHGAQIPMRAQIPHFKMGMGGRGRRLPLTMPRNPDPERLTRGARSLRKQANFDAFNSPNTTFLGGQQVLYKTASTRPAAKIILPKPTGPPPNIASTGQNLPVQHMDTSLGLYEHQQALLLNSPMPKMYHTPMPMMDEYEDNSSPHGYPWDSSSTPAPFIPKRNRDSKKALPHPYLRP